MERHWGKISKRYRVILQYWAYHRVKEGSAMDTWRRVHRKLYRGWILTIVVPDVVVVNQTSQSYCPKEREHTWICSCMRLSETRSVVRRTVPNSEQAKKWIQRVLVGTPEWSCVSASKQGRLYITANTSSQKGRRELQGKVVSGVVA